MNHTEGLRIRHAMSYLRYMTPSEILRTRLPQLRREQNLSQEELARLMNEQGYSWVRSTVAKIESGARAVSIDEVISLAFVMGVHPTALLLPLESATVNVTPTTTAPSDLLWRWMAGQEAFPADGEMDRRRMTDDEWTIYGKRLRRFEEACPDYVVVAERDLPGIRNLADLVGTAQMMAGLVGKEPKKDDDLIEVGADVIHDTVSFFLENISARASQLVENWKREQR